jgi:hypothetical protein
MPRYHYEAYASADSTEPFTTGEVDADTQVDAGDIIKTRLHELGALPGLELIVWEVTAR